MADEPNETRAFYKALADFSAIKRELRSYRSELAKTKAAEAAFNAQANKNRAAQTEAAKKRAAAIRDENNALKQAITNLGKYNTLLAAQKKATVESARQAAKQGKSLETTTKRLKDATDAQRKYNASQRKPRNTADPARDTVRALREEQQALGNVTAARKNSSRAVREEAQEYTRSSQSRVRFIEDVGQVDTATGEVVETTNEATAATSRWSAALEQGRNFLRRNMSDTAALTRAQEVLNRARERQADDMDRLRIAEARHNEVVAKHGATSNQAIITEARLSRVRRALAASTDEVTKATARLKNEGNGLPPITRNITRGADDMYRGFKKFGDWRPRLIPPFVALVPIIGAVVAAINPLVAIIGTLGPLTLGLASSIGSLSGAFVALPGILSAVVSGLASVIASFGGVGSVFKAYGAMQKATTKAGRSTAGGQSQADRAYDLARAEYNLAKAQKNVTKAQERLNDARQEAIQDLVDLRAEVSRAGLDEERAIANLRKAQEEYWNVMADPGSTLGDKMDAVVSIKEAEKDLQDVRDTNVKNQKELNEAERKGIENSDKVVAAKEDLADATWSARDAERSLRQENNQTAQGMDAVAAATDEFADAMAKLSPSAQAFVWAILGMQEQWLAFKKTIQEAFFSEFVDDLDRLPRILQSIEKFLKPSATSMGIFTSNLLELLDSPEWAEDFAGIGEQNGRVLDEMGRGALNLLDAMKDIIVAAGPFTEWLVGGLADGLGNFKELVNTARSDGSLAAWLETAAGRMERWWQVIKNIGSTLFNYSAAASDFGDWILDNLVDMTAGWAESAKKARDDGSAFQQWLEDIKPLLSEINGMFGDFFGWFRNESMDPKNIQDATDLVKIIREDLGPALGGLLDALADTEIDEKFIESLARIIESLTTVMENGGGTALETFFDIVEDFFDWLAGVTSDLDPGALEAILKVLGALAGITFVGKFTGATYLIGAILNLGKNAVGANLLKDILKGFGGLDKLSFTGVIGLLGRLLKVAGVAGAIASVVGGLIDVGSKGMTGFNAAQNGDVATAKKNTTNVDSGLLFQQNPLVPAGPGSNPLPIVVQLAGTVDEMFGTDFKGQLQKFVDDSTREIGNFALDVQKNFQTTWGNIQTEWGNFWDDMGNPEYWRGLGEGLGQFLLEIGTNWSTFWNETVPEAWEQFWVDRGTDLASFGTTFRQGWGTFLGGIQTGWNTLWNGLKTGQLWTNIGMELANFGSTFMTNWNNFWNGVPGAVSTAVTGMSGIWSGIQNLFATPVNWVIENVWNRGIVQFWNGLASKLGWGTLSTFGGIPTAQAPQSGRPVNRGMYAEGGVLPGYTPGRDVHEFYSPTGGRLSLSGGEAIMRPEFVRAIGGEKAVHELNRKARKGEAFANGGVLNRGSLRKPQNTSTSPRTDAQPDWMTSLFGGPVKFMKDSLNKIVQPLFGNIGNSDYANMIKTIPGKAVDGVANWVKGMVPAPDMAGGGPAPANVMGWRAQWAAVKAAFPSAWMSSNYRPGSITVNGGQSYHALGRAIDVTPSTAIFNWIKQNYPNSRELIYTPMGNRQLQNGRETTWGANVAAQHWNHVHWAMKNGGVLPGLFDDGGLLQHGQIGVNRSGKPEAVLDPEQTRRFQMLFSGSGLAAMPTLAATPGAGVNVGSTRVVDNSVNIEHYTVQNPVPERASDSLPKTIRKVGYVNSARSS